MERTLALTGLGPEMTLARDVMTLMHTLPQVRTQSSPPTAGKAGTGGFLVRPGRGNGRVNTLQNLSRGVEGVLGGCTLRPRELCAGFLGYSCEYARHGLCP